MCIPKYRARSAVFCDMKSTFLLAWENIAYSKYWELGNATEMYGGLNGEDLLRGCLVKNALSIVGYMWSRFGSHMFVTDDLMKS